MRYVFITTLCFVLFLPFSSIADEWKEVTNSVHDSCEVRLLLETQVGMSPASSIYPLSQRQIRSGVSSENFFFAFPATGNLVLGLARADGLPQVENPNELQEELNNLVRENDILQSNIRITVADFFQTAYLEIEYLKPNLSGTFYHYELISALNYELQERCPDNMYSSKKK